MTDSKDNVILLVNMFSGSHLIKNTAHEMINIFRPDEELSNLPNEKSSDFYLYVPPRGTMTEKVEKVLMVRHLGSGIYEVIGRAMDLENVTKKNQDELLCEIKFNKRKIPEIIKPYIKDVEKITFKAGLCERPKQPIYLCCPTAKNARHPYDVNATRIDIKELVNGKLFGQSQRRYIRKNKNEALYNMLNEEFFKAPEETKKQQKYTKGWESFPTYGQFKSEQKSKGKGTEKSEDAAPRFLSLICKEDSELAYSNMLAFFLEKDKPFCERFLSNLLSTHDVAIGNVEDSESSEDLAPLNIAREEKRIDLLINTVDRVFIFENKINAPLDEVERLPNSRVKDTSEGEQDNERERAKIRYEVARGELGCGEQLAAGQLQTYVDEVAKELNELGSDKAIHVFILCPSRHELYQDYVKFKKGENGGKQRMIIMDTEGKDLRPVPVVSYSDIRRFLKDALIEEGGVPDNLTRREQGYFDDFMAMLAWQEADDHSDQNKMFMNKSRERFVQAVENAEMSNR